MANFRKVEVAWAGSPVVGAGVSTFYYGEGSTDAPSGPFAFFDTIKGRVPVGVQWTIPNSGDLIDEASGDVVGIWVGTGGGTVPAEGGADFVNGVGARVRWLTGAFNNGRAVVGSTFVVPLNAAQFEGAGNIIAACLTTLGLGCTALLNATEEEPYIYHRPVNGSGGEMFQVGAAQVPDKVSWLRSRRT